MNTHTKFKNNICGPCCLKHILDFFEIRSSLSELTNLSHTGPQGTNVAGLIEAAEHFGVTAHPLQCDVELLKKICGIIEAPFIAHVHPAHYVVIEDIQDETISIYDPARRGSRNLSLAEFEKLWDGYIILFQKRKVNK